MRSNGIIYQQIRNATVKITYKGTTFLVDPYFRPKGEDGCFQIAPKPELKKLKNPLNELPFPINEIVKNIDGVILSHTHGDHWDRIMLQQKIYQKMFQFLFRINQIRIY